MRQAWYIQLQKSWSEIGFYIEWLIWHRKAVLFKAQVMNMMEHSQFIWVTAAPATLEIQHNPWMISFPSTALNNHSFHRCTVSTMCTIYKVKCSYSPWLLPNPQSLKPRRAGNRCIGTPPRACSPQVAHHPDLALYCCSFIITCLKHPRKWFWWNTFPRGGL